MKMKLVMVDMKARLGLYGGDGMHSIKWHLRQMAHKYIPLDDCISIYILHFLPSLGISLRIRLSGDALSSFPYPRPPRSKYTRKEHFCIVWLMRIISIKCSMR